MANGSDVRDGDFDFGKEDEAVRALQTRGVTGALRLLEHATPDAIIAACAQWDKNSKAGIGLLVQMVRDGGVQPASKPDSPGKRLREAFIAYVVGHPAGSVATSHLALQRLRGDLDPVGQDRDYPGDEPCTGGMMLLQAQYPVLSLECDVCGLELAVPAGKLKAIVGRDAQVPA